MTRRKHESEVDAVGISGGSARDVMKCHGPASASAVSAGPGRSFMGHRSPFGQRSRMLPGAPAQGRDRSGERPCFARIAGGRGRVSAPARFTRLIARARRRAHLPRRPAPGSFSRPPAIASLRRKAERRPRKPPLSIVIIHPVRPESSPLRGLNSRYVLHRAKGTRLRAGQVDAALGFFSASGSNPITQNSGICARISHPWPERFREKSFSIFRTG